MSSCKWIVLVKLKLVHINQNKISIWRLKKLVEIYTRGPDVLRLDRVGPNQDLVGKLLGCQEVAKLHQTEGLGEGPFNSYLCVT